MAEKAAHLTATSYAKTSIFEVIAQDSLNATIYPAFQKFLSFLSSYHPQKLHWLTDYCDEIYLVLNGFLQYRYIQKYSASFAEYFYGLKRAPAYNTTVTTLSTTQKNLSLIFLVLFPYVHNKLEDKLNLFKLELASGVKLKKWERRSKKALCLSHNFYHLFLQTWKMFQYIRYMCGKSNIQTPDLHILRLKLVYAELERVPGFWSLFFREGRIPKVNADSVGSAVSGLLEFAAFFLQFLQSWQNEISSINLKRLPIPEPPQYDPRAADYKRKCPLCMQSWKNPAVVVSSGYIYCFRCIVQHLQESQFCPVTRIPVTMSDIIRLYGR